MGKDNRTRLSLGSGNLTFFTLSQVVTTDFKHAYKSLLFQLFSDQRFISI